MQTASFDNIPIVYWNVDGLELSSKEILCIIHKDRDTCTRERIWVISGLTHEMAVEVSRTTEYQSIDLDYELANTSRGCPEPLFCMIIVPKPWMISDANKSILTLEHNFIWAAISDEAGHTARIFFMPPTPSEPKTRRREWDVLFREISTSGMIGIVCGEFARPKVPAGATLLTRFSAMFWTGDREWLEILFECAKLRNPFSHTSRKKYMLIPEKWKIWHQDVDAPGSIRATIQAIWN